MIGCYFSQTALHHYPTQLNVTWGNFWNRLFFSVFFLIYLDLLLYFIFESILKFSFCVVVFSIMKFLLSSLMTSALCLNIVPMNKNLKIFLKNLSNDNKYVIGADFNNKQALCSFSATISKYFKRIGIEGTAHTCRHTFISHLIMKGVDGSVVQRWARINKPEILQVYLHLSPKYSNEAINLLPY